MSAKYGALEAQSAGSTDFEDDLNHNSSTSISKSKRQMSPAFLVGAVLVSFTILFAVFNKYDVGMVKKTLDIQSFASTGSDNALFTLYRNKYAPMSYFTSNSSSAIKYAFLDSHVSIIEPNAPMVLYVEDYDSTATTYFEFKVCGQAGGCKTGYMSNSKDPTLTKSVNIDCSPYSVYSITAYEKSYEDDETVYRTLSGTAMCMYVRREFRDLTDSDLSDTMDAMYTLWNTSDTEGAALYGDNFHSATYFSEAHHFNAAWRDADHIHEGLGFLPQHLKLTNLFEKSMQAVNPAVTLPYWDYTIESAAGLNLFESPVFSDETFGSIIPPNNATLGWSYRYDNIEDAAIPDGRWAKIKVSASRYEGLQYNFGFLRAPWNANPSEYVSRFAAYTTSLPTCENFYDWLQEDTLVDFLKASPYSPHASTHGAIGSVYGCDKMDYLTEQGIILNFKEQMLLCQKWPFMVKELYRKDRISMSNNCSFSRDEESSQISDMECQITCNDQDGLMKNDLGLLISDRYVGDLDTDQLGVLKDFVCDGDSVRILVGDQLESASPIDPSFWPMHPLLDRAYQAKVLAGGFSSTSWPSDAKEDYVCDKATCYEAGEQSYWDACCTGHYEFDQMLDFVNGDKNAGFGLTNRQVLLDADASSSDYAMPYIYADFEWSHCSQNFKELLVGLRDGNSKTK